MLPIVQIMVMAVKLTAIIDTGAARCLLSNALADIIWGNTWRSRVDTNQVCYLRDVNANPVPTIGSLQIDFQINTTSFKHCFIIFQSESNEVLLGFDFLKKFQIGVFPNLGLIFENYPVNKVANILPSVFPLHISQSITLQAMAQQVVEVHVSIPNTPDILPMLAESNVLAHSQILEPDVQWEHLSVFFQYISISPELTSQVLIVNNLDYMVTYDRNAVIGHIELLNMVASKEEIQNDPLASVLLGGHG